MQTMSNSLKGFLGVLAAASIILPMGFWAKTCENRPPKPKIIDKTVKLKCTPTNNAKDTKYVCSFGNKICFVPALGRPWCDGDQGIPPEVEELTQ